MLDFFREWFGRKPAGDGRMPEELLAREAFESSLLNERARADRAGSTFSLVTFKVAAAAGQEHAAAERVLAHILVKRTRTIDVKGYYGEGLGLILPYTPSSKVDIVWQNIQDSYRRRLAAESLGRVDAPPLSCEVYAYPSNERVSLTPGVGRPK